MDPSKHKVGSPSKPSRPAPSHGAAYRGETPSSSSSLRPPPPQQQQGHVIPPVPLRETSLPVDHEADAFPSELESQGRRMRELYLRDSPRRVRVDASRSAVYGYASAHPTPPHPRVHDDETTRGGASVVSSIQRQQGPIPPLHPQFGSAQRLYGGSETSSSGTAPVGTARPSAVDLFYGRRETSSSGAAPAGTARPSAVELFYGRRGTSSSSAAPVGTARPSGVGLFYAPQTWPQPPQRHAGEETRSSHSGAPEPPIHQDSRLEKIRLESLRSPMTLEQLLMSCSAFVVQLLEQGDKEIRHRVLGWFVHRAHEIMGNRQGHAVFATLLRICRWRYEELRSIVEAAVTPSLVSRSNDGVTSLKMLIAEVARHWDLSERLVGSFVNERVMDEAGGDELIAHCFTTMPYEVTKALIRHALDTINDKLESEYGSRCLAVCFRNARADELKDFEKVICEGAIDMAKGQYSNYFMQGVLEHGDIGVQYAVVDQLMTEVASLSCHHYGHYVLQSCILKTGDYRGELLRRLIQELERLGDTQLAGLVKNRFGSRLLSRLLDTAETPRFRKERWGWELAQRIRRASAAHVGPDLEKTNAKRVMKSVDRMGLS
ncbi:hypothetical protein CFC21_051191 [Triticum aestivum]|uniref:PUM-HD domain-containing protein n=2 Tax=Triticum aestivum TaxID=4565 RepID=A0A9R1G7P8_WHEAT|nr:maternal protein pumilio-like [Triticum aestivum]KAF7041386.1 hypothetical protein CFC21_051191 [Triticum aestivum]